ncbi:hypothetical protein, partial [Deinococcus alpinitundrae]|uniref:hypothetical protein n=1 Tax=Deinococcus alpinitundrae TaxID=468913 RepID=UPI001ED8F256
VPDRGAPRGVISRNESAECRSRRTFLHETINRNISVYSLAVDCLLLFVATCLLYSGARQLHYRDAPYLFLRRWLLWGTLSFFLHGMVRIGVMLMLLDRYSTIWWLVAVLGSFPALMTFSYAIRAIHDPQRVAGMNYYRWKGPELTP